jgi:ABC-type transporter Mla MlaB component
VLSNDVIIFGDTFAYVTLRGQLVLGDETRDFRSLMQRLTSGEYLCILIDLRQVDKIDSAGLGELSKWISQAHDTGTAIALQQLPCQLQSLLIITRLIVLFDGCRYGLEMAA